MKMSRARTGCCAACKEPGGTAAAAVVAAAAASAAGTPSAAAAAGRSPFPERTDRRAASSCSVDRRSPSVSSRRGAVDGSDDQAVWRDSRAAGWGRVVGIRWEARCRRARAA